MKINRRETHSTPHPRLPVSCFPFGEIDMVPSFVQLWLGAERVETEAERSQAVKEELFRLLFSFIVRPIFGRVRNVAIQIYWKLTSAFFISTFAAASAAPLLLPSLSRHGTCGWLSSHTRCEDSQGNMAESACQILKGFGQSVRGFRAGLWSSSGHLFG